MGEDSNEPGTDLTPIQRELVELMATEGVSAAEAARRCNVPISNAYYWRRTTPWKRYATLLVTEAVHDAVQRSRAILAGRLPAIAQRAADYAEGKTADNAEAIPGAYQDKFMRLVFDNVMGRPQAAPTIEAGVEVPGQHGPIRIIFKAGE